MYVCTFSCLTNTKVYVLGAVANNTTRLIVDVVLITFNNFYSRYFLPTVVPIDVTLKADGIV